MTNIFPIDPLKSTLTKYEASKVSELMCPRCAGELENHAEELGHSYDHLQFKKCKSCGVIYVGEEKKDDHAGT